MKFSIYPLKAPRMEAKGLLFCGGAGVIKVRRRELRVGDGSPAGILAVAVVERSELANIGGAAGTAETGRIGLDVESWVKGVGAGSAIIAVHAARQGGKQW